MKHNIAAPDSAAVETLIAPAFDEAFALDPVRMQAIRNTLAHEKSGSRSHKKLNTLPWRAVLLLTGGLAVAAGWLVTEFWTGGSEPDNGQMEQAAGYPAITPELNRHPDRTGQPDRIRQQQDPVIYRREPD